MHLKPHRESALESFRLGTANRFLVPLAYVWGPQHGQKVSVQRDTHLSKEYDAGKEEA